MTKYLDSDAEMVTAEAAAGVYVPKSRGRQPVVSARRADVDGKRNKALMAAERDSSGYLAMLVSLTTGGLWLRICRR